MSLLDARGLTKHYSGLKAVDGVDFALEPGELHALIGPNGAGKTTLVSLLSGRILADQGRLRFDGADITRLSAHQRVRRGIAYTFQITSIYPRHSVRENVELALLSRRGAKSEAEAALDRVGLLDRAEDLAGTLSYGHQRLLELAMGLALAPKLLILDEPTQGLAAGEIDRFRALIASLVPQTTVLMIEHNMEVVMDLAQRITVLNFGKVLAQDTPAEIRANAQVQEAYLGV